MQRGSVGRRGGPWGAKGGAEWVPGALRGSVGRRGGPRGAKGVRGAPKGSPGRRVCPWGAEEVHGAPRGSPGLRRELMITFLGLINFKCTRSLMASERASRFKSSEFETNLICKG